MLTLTRRFDNKVWSFHHPNRVIHMKRSFVSEDRPRSEAHTYVSERSPVELFWTNCPISKVLLTNHGKNDVLVHDRKGSLRRIKPGARSDVCYHSIRLCPNWNAEGVEQTDFDVDVWN